MHGEKKQWKMKFCPQSVQASPQPWSPLQRQPLLEGLWGSISRAWWWHLEDMDKWYIMSKPPQDQKWRFSKNLSGSANGTEQQMYLVAIQWPWHGAGNKAKATGMLPCSSCHKGPRSSRRQVSESQLAYRVSQRAETPSTSLEVKIEAWGGGTCL